VEILLSLMVINLMVAWKKNGYFARQEDKEYTTTKEKEKQVASP